VTWIIDAKAASERVVRLTRVCAGEATSSAPSLELHLLLKGTMGSSILDMLQADPTLEQ
jgi:hypothetical protein